MVNSNWFDATKEEDVGIPVDPPVGIVNMSPLPYPYPVFLTSKSITLDPCPTTISIVAALPVPAEPEVWVRAIPEYERGSSITISSGLLTFPHLA